MVEDTGNDMLRMAPGSSRIRAVKRAGEVFCNPLDMRPGAGQLERHDENFCRSFTQFYKHYDRLSTIITITDQLDALFTLKAVKTGSETYDSRSESRFEQPGGCAAEIC